MKKLRQIRENAGEIFPQPENNECLETNPPSFCWLKNDGIDSYQVIVKNADDQVVLDQRTDSNFLVLCHTLPTGTYRWNVMAGDQERGWQTFSIPDAATEFIVPSAADILKKIPDHHPRHIYYPEDIENLCRKHKTELGIIRRNIEIALADDIPEYPGFHREGHDDYRIVFGRLREQIDRNLVACALGYLFLKDSAAGDYAKRFVLKICEWNPAGPCSVAGPWGDEVGLSICRCLFSVYDWTYDLYTQNERSFIEQTLKQHARQVYELLKNTDFIANPGRSHAGRIPAYLGEAALVLHGCIPDETVEQWLQYALDVYGSFFPFYGDKDGGWAEGVFYATSYTKWFLPFFFSIERHCDFSFLEQPFYRRVSQFFTHFATPGWESHPFCDGYWCSPDSPEWPGFFAQNPFSIYAERFGPDLARKFSKQLATPEYYKLHLLDVIRNDYKPLIDNAAGPVSNCQVFQGSGFISLRKNIQEPENDIAVIARCSKRGSSSHQHADQGNFAIISKGKTLITPSGYFGFAFGTPHHREWTQQTQAHNCILVNGEGQTRDHSSIGLIKTVVDNEKSAEVEMDLTKAYPMLTSYQRTLSFDRSSQLLVVSDEIEAGEAVRISWLLHSLSEPKQHEEGVVIERGESGLELQLQANIDSKLNITDQFAVDVNSGMPFEKHVDFPQQYHMSWQLGESKRLLVKATFKVW